MTKQNNFGISCWSTMAYSLASLFFIQVTGVWAVLCLLGTRTRTCALQDEDDSSTDRTRYSVVHLSSSVTVSKVQWKEGIKIFTWRCHMPLIFSTSDWLSLKHWVKYQAGGSAECRESNGGGSGSSLWSDPSVQGWWGRSALVRRTFQVHKKGVLENYGLSEAKPEWHFCEHIWMCFAKIENQHPGLEEPLIAFPIYIL